MKAAHPSARQAHLKMASGYEDLAGAIEARERYLGLDQPEVAQPLRSNQSS